MSLWLTYFRPRMLQMLLLGFSSGLPLALTGTTLQAWYTVSGLSVVAIGFLALVGQPYTYKFFWAPLMDRFIPPFLGRRRGWMLILQLALLIAIASMAAFDPHVRPTTLALLALIVAFLSASQDICLDAYRADILSTEERGTGSAMWIAGYRIAMLVSGGVALIMAEYIGWHETFLIMALLMLIGVVTTLCSPSPANDQARPLSLGAAISEPLQDFLKRPYLFAILLFIILYKMGDAFAVSLSTTFYLRGLGFSLAEVGAMMKTMTLIATLLGLFIGGSLMLRLGMYRALMLFGILQGVTNLFSVWLALVGKSFLLLAVTIFAENVTGGMGNAAFLAFLMALCNVRYTATQLALLSALMAVGRVFIGPFAGLLVEHVGWAEFFVWSFIAALPGLFLLRWLKHKINFEAERII